MSKYLWDLCHPDVYQDYQDASDLLLIFKHMMNPDLLAERTPYIEARGKASEAHKIKTLLQPGDDEQGKVTYGNSIRDKYDDLSTCNEIKNNVETTVAAKNQAQLNVWSVVGGSHFKALLRVPAPPAKTPRYIFLDPFGNLKENIKPQLESIQKLEKGATLEVSNTVIQKNGWSCGDISVLFSYIATQMLLRDPNIESKQIFEETKRKFIEYGGDLAVRKLMAVLLLTHREFQEIETKEPGSIKNFLGKSLYEKLQNDFPYFWNEVRQPILPRTIDQVRDESLAIKNELATILGELRAEEQKFYQEVLNGPPATYFMDVDDDPNKARDDKIVEKNKYLLNMHLALKGLIDSTKNKDQLKKLNALDDKLKDYYDYESIEIQNQLGEQLKNNAETQLGMGSVIVPPVEKDVADYNPKIKRSLERLLKKLPPNLQSNLLQYITSSFEVMLDKAKYPKELFDAEKYPSRLQLISEGFINRLKSVPEKDREAVCENLKWMAKSKLQEINQTWEAMESRFVGATKHLIETNLTETEKAEILHYFLNGPTEFEAFYDSLAGKKSKSPAVNHWFDNFRKTSVNLMNEIPATYQNQLLELFKKQVRSKFEARTPENNLESRLLNEESSKWSKAKQQLFNFYYVNKLFISKDNYEFWHRKRIENKTFAINDKAENKYEKTFHLDKDVHRLMLMTEEFSNLKSEKDFIDNLNTAKNMLNRYEDDVFKTQTKMLAADTDLTDHHALLSPDGKELIVNICTQRRSNADGSITNNGFGNKGLPINENQQEYEARLKSIAINILLAIQSGLYPNLETIKLQEVPLDLDPYNKIFRDTLMKGNGKVKGLEEMKWGIAEGIDTQNKIEPNRPRPKIIFDEERKGNFGNITLFRPGLTHKAELTKTIGQAFHGSFKDKKEAKEQANRCEIQVFKRENGEYVLSVNVHHAYLPRGGKQSEDEYQKAKQESQKQAIQNYKKLVSILKKQITEKTKEENPVVNLRIGGDWNHSLDGVVSDEFNQATLEASSVSWNPSTKQSQPNKVDHFVTNEIQPSKEASIVNLTSKYYPDEIEALALLKAPVPQLEVPAKPPVQADVSNLASEDLINDSKNDEWNVYAPPPDPVQEEVEKKPEDQAVVPPPEVQEGVQPVQEVVNQPVQEVVQPEIQVVNQQVNNAPQPQNNDNNAPQPQNNDNNAPLPQENNNEPELELTQQPAPPIQPQQQAPQHFIDLKHIQNNILNDVYLAKLKYLQKIQNEIAYGPNARAEIDKNIELLDTIDKKIRDYRKSDLHKNMDKGKFAISRYRGKRNKDNIEEKIEELVRLNAELYAHYQSIQEKPNEATSYSEKTLSLSKKNGEDDAAFQTRINAELAKFVVGPNQQPALKQAYTNAITKDSARINYNPIPLRKDEKFNTATVQTVKDGSYCSTFYFDKTKEFKPNREVGITRHGPYSIPDDRLMNWAMIQVLDYLAGADSSQPMFLRGSTEKRHYVEAVMLAAAYLNKVEGKTIDIRNLTKHTDIKLTDFTNAQIFGFQDRIQSNKSLASDFRKKIMPQNVDAKHFQPYEDHAVDKAKILDKHTNPELDKQIQLK